MPLVIAAKPNVNEKSEPEPADLYVAGPQWLLGGRELEGRFPLYRDVMPISASRFSVDRKLLAETLKQVMLSTGDCSRGVGVVLRPRSIELTASSPDTGTASAKLPARFLGGGDRTIDTGFNPNFLVEAVKSLPGERIVFDLGQNGYADKNTIYSKATLLYPEDNERVRWHVMPINMGYPTTREYLGSNFKEELADAG